MKNLLCRSEYSFNFAYGHIDKVVASNAFGICDRGGTWGHVRYMKECKKLGRKPVYGVELAVVSDASLRSKDQPVAYYSFLAKNDAGLVEMYKLVTKASDGFYFFPRLSRRDLYNISDNVIVVAPDYDHERAPSFCYVALTQTGIKANIQRALARGLRPLAASDNRYPTTQYKPAYEIVVGKRARDNRTAPMHILDEDEWRYYLRWLTDEDKQLAIENTEFLYDICNAALPTAEMVKYPATQTLLEMCQEGAIKRNINLDDEVYAARLKRELSLIHEKKFEDYFYVLADMIMFAKQHMLVGPARGSSCGSLVCYLLFITDVDPIPFDLLFERFIDVTRMDLPDIDVDFQDDRRYMVFDYLKEKYGADCVARIGTVNRYKAASTLGKVADELDIPKWELDAVKNAMLKRSTGDARAQFCILDTFNELQVGKELLAKYPQIRVAAELEGHSSHSGQHAAGVIVTEVPVANFCAVDNHTGAAQIDKKDAEDLGLLKIDALGLRTLSVIQDCLDEIGWSREQLLAHTLHDEDAFAVVNKGHFSGVFQFEGNALQNLCRQMRVESFEDIVSLTSLARPGPLVSGGATDFIKRRTGQEPVTYLHPMAEEATRVTLGTIVYQEQVMQLGRHIGALSWEDVSTLRKAMSKSYGKEYFDQFFEKFWTGAEKNGLTLEEARHVWDHMNTMGSWSFNRSHAVAYGLVSYWCMVLKAHFPLQFAAAGLRNAKDNEAAILMLKEIVNEGYTYKPVDAVKSQLNWSVQGGELVGGLTNLIGVGPKKAEEIIARREAGIAQTPAIQKLLNEPKTPFDLLFEARQFFGGYYDNPEQFKVNGPVLNVQSILASGREGQVCFLGKLMTKNIRDDNEAINVQKRGGVMKEGETRSLNFNLQDDTGALKCRIQTKRFQELGLGIVEEGIIGQSWYLVRGRYTSAYNMVFVEKVKKLK